MRDTSLPEIKTSGWNRASLDDWSAIFSMKMLTDRRLPSAGVFNFAVSGFFRLLALVFTNTEVVQCLTDALAIRQTSQNRGGSHVRMAAVQVGGNSRRGHILTKLQVWIRT